MENRPPLPLFTQQSAAEKVQLAENGWNSKNPVKVACAAPILDRLTYRIKFYFKSTISKHLYPSKQNRCCTSAYTIDCQWRNRAEIFLGRENIIGFLTRKWEKELDYRLKKELWCFADNRIAVTFRYERHDDLDQWYRSYGNELWEYAANGLYQY